MVDVRAHISVVGIEIRTVDDGVVATSVDTYLQYGKTISNIGVASQSGALEDIQDLDIDTPARPDSFEAAPTQ